MSRILFYFLCNIVGGMEGKRPRGSRFRDCWFYLLYRIMYRKKFPGPKTAVHGSLRFDLAYSPERQRWLQKVSSIGNGTPKISVESAIRGSGKHHRHESRSVHDIRGSFFHGSPEGGVGLGARRRGERSVVWGNDCENPPKKNPQLVEREKKHSTCRKNEEIHD